MAFFQALEGKIVANNTSFSLVDLAISLMVIFILLFVATIHNMGKSTETAREQLMKALQGQNIGYEASSTDPFTVKSVIPDDKLQFMNNKAELLPAGKEFLDLFIVKEAQAVCHGAIKNKIQAIYVVGHANSIGTDEHNLKLSQERALAVMMYALNNKKLSEEERNCLFELISVNGRGKREPVLKQNGSEDLIKSRRVEIIHRVKTAEELQHQK